VSGGGVNTVDACTDDCSSTVIQLFFHTRRHLLNSLRLLPSTIAHEPSDIPLMNLLFMVHLYEPSLRWIAFVASHRHLSRTSHDTPLLSRTPSTATMTPPLRHHPLSLSLYRNTRSPPPHPNYQPTAPLAAWSKLDSPPPSSSLSGLGRLPFFRVQMLLGTMVLVVLSGE
jgi:hypothetical protein